MIEELKCLQEVMLKSYCLAVKTAVREYMKEKARDVGMSTRALEEEGGNEYVEKLWKSLNS